jgi:hypothetical protein
MKKADLHDFVCRINHVANCVEDTQASYSNTDLEKVAIKMNEIFMKMTDSVCDLLFYGITNL